MQYVYQYGLLAPDVNEKLINDQMYVAHQTYNDLIKLTRISRERVSEVEKEHSEKLASLVKTEEEVEGAFDSIKKEIKRLRSLKPKEGKDTHQASINSAKERGKQLVVDLKALRQQIKAIKEALQEDPVLQQKKQIVYDEKHDAFLDVYARRTSKENEVPLYWPSYNLVKDAVAQAAQKFGAPYFRRWTGEGQIGVQQMKKKQKGNSEFVPVESVFGPDNNTVQVAPVDSRAFDLSVPRGERGRFQRTRLRLRLGTVKGTQKPIWGEWPMILHRPFPPGAILCGATVNRRKHADRDKWTVQFTVEVPDKPVTVADDPLKLKMIGIDRGWRKIDAETLRVSYWFDTDGSEGSFELGGDVRERLQKARDLQSIRDQRQDQMKAAVLETLKGFEAPDQELRRTLSHLSKWRSPAKYVRLLRQHRENLPAVTVQIIEVWAKGNRKTCPLDSADLFNGDKHLWQYETGVRRGAILHRREQYRKWAAELVSKYDVIVMEKFHLPGVKNKPSPERKADVPDSIAAMRNASSRQRDEAAPGIELQIIKNAAYKAGKIVLEVPARNTTKTCSFCGHSETWAVKHELVHTCPGCGKTFDRDLNGARNILASGLDVIKTPGVLAAYKAPKAKRKAKWSKRHKASTEVTETP